MKLAAAEGGVTRTGVNWRMLDKQLYRSLGQSLSSTSGPNTSHVLANWLVNRDLSEGGRNRQEMPQGGPIPLPAVTSERSRPPEPPQPSCNPPRSRPTPC